METAGIIRVIGIIQGIVYWGYNVIMENQIGTCYAGFRI